MVIEFLETVTLVLEQERVNSVIISWWENACVLKITWDIAVGHKNAYMSRKLLGLKNLTTGK